MNKAEMVAIVFLIGMIAGGATVMFAALLAVQGMKIPAGFLAIVIAFCGWSFAALLQKIIASEGSSDGAVEGSE